MGQSRGSDKGHSRRPHRAPQPLVGWLVQEGGQYFFIAVLQETVGNIGAEVQWVAQGGESKAQNLHGEVEGIWGKIAELQRTAEELQEITGGLRGTVEGSELQTGATVVLHDLVRRADLNFQLGFLGVYDATKGRWAVELGGLTERMWVKGENLWAEDGMQAKINLIEHVLDEGKPGLL